MLNRRGVLALSITALGTAVILPRLSERISLIFFTGLAGALACLATYWRLRAHRAEREVAARTLPPVLISNPRRRPRAPFPWRQRSSPAEATGREEQPC